MPRRGGHLSAATKAKISLALRNRNARRTHTAHKRQLTSEQFKATRHANFAATRGVRGKRKTRMVNGKRVKLNNAEFAAIRKLQLKEFTQRGTQRVDTRTTQQRAAQARRRAQHARQAAARRRRNGSRRRT